VPESASTPSESPNEELWRGVLLGTDPVFARSRALMKRIPGNPRCKMCSAPFGGPAHLFMHLTGRDRWSKNPSYCGRCFQMLAAHHGGAEIESSYLFADVRGSTALAEEVGPTEFRRQLDRFYGTASRILVEQDAIVDKFVGDEVVAIFIPALAHELHARRAVDSALALLAATGHADEGGPWIPIGIGVHTGVAFVGAVGEAPVTELTALGDVVNTTARLASVASAGEVLITAAAATAAGFDIDGLERRSLELKGKREVTPVVVARARPAATTA
jgi:adenylate cyclase